MSNALWDQTDEHSHIQDPVDKAMPVARRQRWRVGLRYRPGSARDCASSTVSLWQARPDLYRFFRLQHRSDLPVVKFALRKEFLLSLWWILTGHRERSVRCRVDFPSCGYFGLESERIFRWDLEADSERRRREKDAKKEGGGQWGYCLRRGRSQPVNVGSPSKCYLETVRIGGAGVGE